MKFTIWQTSITNKECWIVDVYYDSNSVLKVVLEDKGQQYEIESRCELFEVGKEENYSGLWQVLNQQGISKDSRTTLECLDSAFVKRIALENYVEYRHFVVNGFSKTIHIISELEPQVRKV